jgi:bifunctional ADP-heptose synthase (sugar kinase/adenylyltransferase)
LRFLPIIEKERESTVKHRFFLEKSGITYKNYQIDYLDNREIKEKEILLDKVKTIISDMDLILLVDYRHGMMSLDLIENIKKISKENKITTIASSQVSESKTNHRNYSGVDLICMNLKEAEYIYPNAFLYENGKVSGLNNLSFLLDSGICVTLGDKGSCLYTHDSEEEFIYYSPAIKVKEVDSCGAGDSFLAAFSLSDYKKNPEEALYLGNCFAGLSVKNLGTETPKKQDLISLIENEKFKK